MFHVTGGGLVTSEFGVWEVGHGTVNECDKRSLCVCACVLVQSCRRARGGGRKEMR